MKTMILGKRDTQILLRRIRQAGHYVKRIGESGYEVWNDGERIFRAMIGNRSYLISYSPDLITHRQGRFQAEITGQTETARMIREETI